eukprot:2552987-Amphidinium_carterae.1
MLNSPAVPPPSGPVWSGFVRPREESFQGSDRGDTARMRHTSVLAGALGALPPVDEDHTCMISGDPVWDRDPWDPNFERSRSGHWQRPA